MTSGKEEIPQKPSSRNQLIGAFLGFMVGLLLLSLFPDLQTRFDWVTFLIWTAAIGSALASLRQFERAGQILTHSENKALNYAVGFAAEAAILIIFTVILRAISGS